MSADAIQRAPLAAFLRHRRQELKLSMAEVAQRCRKTISWYDRIESSGRRGLSRADVALLEKALELSPGAVEKRAREAGL